MALYTRLISKQLGARMSGAYRTTIPYENVALRTITMKFIKDPKENVKDLLHDYKNMKLGRPMSPHLTIYAPQLTSMMSITHRMMGITLTGYTTVIGLGSLFLSHPFEYYVDMIQGWELPWIVLLSTKYLIAFPFVYHLMNGVRHLFWDAGFNLRIKQVYATGYLVLLLTFGITGALAML